MDVGRQEVGRAGAGRAFACLPTELLQVYLPTRLPACPLARLLLPGLAPCAQAGPSLMRCTRHLPPRIGRSALDQPSCCLPPVLLLLTTFTHRQPCCFQAPCPVPTWLADWHGTQAMPCSAACITPGPHLSLPHPTPHLPPPPFLFLAQLAELRKAQGGLLGKVLDVVAALAGDSNDAARRLCRHVTLDPGSLPGTGAQHVRAITLPTTVRTWGGLLLLAVGMHWAGWLAECQCSWTLGLQDHGGGVGPG